MGDGMLPYEEQWEDRDLDKSDYKALIGMFLFAFVLVLFMALFSDNDVESDDEIEETHAPAAEYIGDGAPASDVPLIAGS